MTPIDRLRSALDDPDLAELSIEIMVLDAGSELDRDLAARALDRVSVGSVAFFVALARST